MSWGQKRGRHWGQSVAGGLSVGESGDPRKGVDEGVKGWDPSQSGRRSIWRSRMI